MIELKDISFATASIVSESVTSWTPQYEKKNVDNWFKDKLFNYMFGIFQKWGNINPHYENVVTKRFTFDETKRKLVSNKIQDELEKRYRIGNISPKTHIVLMGEVTFFDIVKEKGDEPFFVGMTSFKSNEEFYYDPYRGKSVYQYSCHIVDGMQGFAFVPKVIVEIRE